MFSLPYLSSDSWPLLLVPLASSLPRSPSRSAMTHRLDIKRVGHNASKQWNAVEDQYEIDVARCYQKWGRRMPPCSRVADYLRWDAMREDELDRLKAKRDKALKAIPTDTTPSAPPRSPPPSRPRRPVSPPSSYPMSPIMSTVTGTTQLPARSETLDAPGRSSRPLRPARPLSILSVPSSPVTHCE